MADPIAAARALIEPLARYGDPKGRGASHPQNRLCADAAAAIATLADALEAERAENKRLRVAKEAAVDTLNAWFDRRKLAHEAIDQAVVDAAGGYLRTSRVGGMPQSESDLVLGVISDMARLSLFADLFARASLDKMLAEARLEGWRAGRDAATEPLTSLAAVLRESTNSYHQSQASALLERAGAIQALPEPKETSHV